MKYAHQTDPMKILALDLSLTATGYADSEGNSGSLRPPPKMAGFDRITWIRNAILDRWPQMDLYALEGYAFGAKGSSLLSLAELGGVIRCALYDESYTYVDVPPANIKKFATGSGNAKKDVVFAEAIRQLKYQGSDHNEADALWLLEFVRAKYSGAPLSETKRSALAKIEWPPIAIAGTISHSSDGEGR